MSDLVRNYPVIFLPLQNNVEQSFGKDDNELKRIYTILNSLRGLYKSGTPPTSPNVGDKWHDSSTDIIKEWNGSIWTPCTAIASLTGASFTGVLNEALGAPIASASTINLTTATGNFLHITGTTAITAVTLGTGMRREVIFDDALTLTHHATNNNLPGTANITTTAGDRASYYSDGTTVYCTKYQKSSSIPADLAGSSLQKFKVANATASDDAIALGQFTSGTGWKKYPDGSIEQWGTSLNSSNQTITLPIAFPVAGLSVVATPLNNTTNITVGNITTTNFVLVTGVSTQSYWRAIGK